LENSKKAFSESIDSLWVNANLATMIPGRQYGAVEDGAIAVSGQRISWIGKRKDLLPGIEAKASKLVDVEGDWITPGLIDCHTHLVYGGCRANEFELRLQGVSYEEIARRGGGIRSTVSATRETDEEALYRQCIPRLHAFMEEGVTTLEIKSGYGLDMETEIRILRVAKRIGEENPITVYPTFLGAHALPPEYEGRSDAYIAFVCNEVLPAVINENLAFAVDVFCENIAFSKEQTERVFRAAKSHGLNIKLHAEQLSDQGGTSLAARYGALSVDHLEHLSEEGVASIAGSGTVAVLLPGAFYFLRETRMPPVELLRQYNIPIAVSTDCNPGSSPAVSILLMLNMACTLFRLTPEEALAGVTRHAARALGLQDRIGSLETGKDADFVIWHISQPAELAYHMGLNPCRRVIKKGVEIRSEASSTQKIICS